jgi:hypothetical protein
MNRLRCFWLGSLLIGLLVTSATTSMEAATITVGGAWPASAEVVTATPDQSSFGQDAPISLAQSFQTDTPFSLQTIFLEYENDTNAAGDKTVTMTIFTVADVNAATHDEPPTSGILLTDSVTFPYVAGTDTVARIALDSPLAISANAGTDGYITRFTDGGDPGWEWRRTGSTHNNTYAGGKAYEDGSEKTDGLRDYTLALSSVPEPSGLALAALAAFAGVFKRIRRLPA